MYLFSSSTTLLVELILVGFVFSFIVLLFFWYLINSIHRKEHILLRRVVLTHAYILSLEGTGRCILNWRCNFFSIAADRRAFSSSFSVSSPMSTNVLSLLEDQTRTRAFCRDSNFWKWSLVEKLGLFYCS